MQRFTKQIDSVKQLFTLLLAIAVCPLGCKGQRQFNEFIESFPLSDIPIDSIQLIKPADTLNVKLFNHIVWESQPTEEKDGKVRIIRPKVFKNDKLIDLMSFGKVSDTPMNYRSVNGQEGQFYTTVYSIVRINLNSKYISIVVKTFNSELAYYDLYNFTKSGKRLSAVPLFTYGHNEMLIDSIDYVFTKSTILKDGSIVWFENNRGLKTSRVYKLRDDGYFEIVKEERTGTFEY